MTSMSDVIGTFARREVVEHRADAAPDRLDSALTALRNSRVSFENMH